MEQRSGPMGWNTMSGNTRPGEIRLYAWQSVSRGADAVVFFRWRSCLSGTEQYWHGLLNHDARPARRYREVAGVGAEFAALAPWIDGTTPRPRVAFVNSYANNWAFRIQPQAPGMEYLLLHTRFHAALTGLGVGADIVPETADLSGYDLVFAPAHYLLSAEFAAKLTAYVEAGGTLLTSSRTGVKNMANVCVEDQLPGLLQPLCGILVEEYDAVGPRKVPLSAPWGGGYEAAVWCDVLELAGAQAVAAYGEHPGNRCFYAGSPALTVNSYGHGRCYYLATVPEEPFYTDLLTNELLPAAGITAQVGLPSGVETMTREADGRRVRFYLNHNRHEVAVPVAQGGKALLLPGVELSEVAKPMASETLLLPAYEVAVILE
jgi:beta-galactosidase